MSILEKEKKYFIQTYKRLPLDISHGEGVHLITKNGIRYLDFFCGIGVNSLGHANERVIAAVQNQLEKFSHLPIILLLMYRWSSLRNL